MTKPSVTNQVDDHILVEGGPPLCSHPTHVHDRLGVIGGHMEDGCIDNPRHIGGVGGGAGHSGVCGEANLRGNNQIAKCDTCKCIDIMFRRTKYVDV